MPSLFANARKTQPHPSLSGFISQLFLLKVKIAKNKKFLQNVEGVMGDPVSDKLLAHPVQGVSEVFPPLGTHNIYTSQQKVSFFGNFLFRKK
jgi:hypothetical protein